MLELRNSLAANDENKRTDVQRGFETRLVDTEPVFYYRMIRISPHCVIKL